MFKVKDRKTADQLSEMIISAMGLRDVYVSVRKDHAYSLDMEVTL
jgi:hypothetical protein